MQGEVTSECANPKTATVHVGIDVCKGHLDVQITGTAVNVAFRVANDKAGTRELLKRLYGHVVALIVMEATGKFHRQVHRRLYDAGFAVTIVNPLRARLFAESLGMLAKNDKVDARMLAIMARAADLKPTPPRPESVENLMELTRARDGLVTQRAALHNQIEAATLKTVKSVLLHQMRATRLDGRQRLVGILGGAGRMALVRENSGDDVADVRFVVDDENVGGHSSRFFLIGAMYQTCSGTGAACESALPETFMKSRT